MLEGLRGEDSIAELCRKEGINQNLYYHWSKADGLQLQRSQHPVEQLEVRGQLPDGFRLDGSLVERLSVAKTYL